MTHLLDIVDMQGDFMHKAGVLYVPGAEFLIARANDFFRALPQGVFDAALFKYDTHFRDEYKVSPEKESFPDIHCEYATPGWALAVDPDLLTGKMDLFYMTKNTFDMWDENPLPQGRALNFKTDDEKAAYANLHRVTPDRRAIAPGMLRDEFMQTRDLGFLQEDFSVTMIGVASDFCVDDAMIGYLKRGASVAVVEDLVAGIGTPVPGRAASGHIRDVIQLPRFQPYVQSGQLRLTTAASVLRAGI